MTLGPADSPEALVAVGHVLVRGLSTGRRRRCRVLVGDGAGFCTDLTDVFVPWPLPAEGSGRGLACALALQASPTKDLVASVGVAALTPRQRRALQLVEGAAALGWARAQWRGLAEPLTQRLPDLDPVPADGLTAGDLVEQALRLADNGLPASALPAILGQLPLVRSPLGRRRAARAQAEARLPWSSPRRLGRLAAGSIAVAGGNGETAARAGEDDPDEEQRLAGRRRARIGVAYPEWNMVTGSYRLDHVTVVERRLPPEAGPPPRPGGPGVSPVVDAHLAAWFEQPLERRWQHRLEDGSDLDIDAVVDVRREDLAGGPQGTRLYRERLATHRDAAVAVLVDRSGSLARAGNLAHEIACADALAGAMTRAGERHAVFAFWGDTRHQVIVEVLSDFDDGHRARPTTTALSPKGYTRIGAALRHVTARLAAVPAHRRILLMLSDGVPCDEGYEGRYAYADVAQAAEEADRAGVALAFLGIGGPVDHPLATMLPRHFHPVSGVSDLAPVLGEVHARLVG
ncbi:MAG: nitric oxide reductase activation protein NorD [Acidimicrobiia bacterium]